MKGFVGWWISVYCKTNFVIMSIVYFNEFTKEKYFFGLFVWFWTAISDFFFHMCWMFDFWSITTWKHCLCQVKRSRVIVSCMKKRSFESCTTHSKVHTNFVLWIRKSSKCGEKYEQFDCSEEKKCVPDNNLPKPFNWSWNMTNEGYSTSFWHCGDQWSTC